MTIAFDKAADPAASPAMRADQAARLATIALVGAAIIFYLTVIIRSAVIVDGRIYFTLFDDAMISMRYAKTFASGGGLVWNPGDAPIEGFTNLLWTLWISLLHLAPVEEGWVPLLVSLSSAASLILAAFGARRLALAMGADRLTAIAVLGAALLYYPLAFWSLRGMETGVLAALMTWAMALALEDQRSPGRPRLFALCAIAAALVLVRQDAVVFVIVLGGFLCATGLPKRRFTGLYVFAATAVSLAMLTAFRWAYYGDLTPNTYTLKVTGVGLGERLQRGFESLFSIDMGLHFAVIIAILALAVPMLLRNRAVLMLMALPLAAFLAQAAYSVFVGGDVWEDLGYPNRFIVIAMPGLLALAIVCLRQAVTMLPPRAVQGGFCGLVALLALQTSAPAALAAMRGEAAYVQLDRAATEVGLCLRRNTPLDTRIAITWAGTMPYYADRFTVDLLGKVDREIARSPPKRDFLPGHNKWDYAYSIDTYRPDIILQLWGEKPADIAMIRSRGYAPMAPAWPCLANGFLSADQVFVRQR
jgi:hypothetical protein